jgi:hypothetical protein
MAPTKEITYKKLFIKFMDFIHGTVYDVQHEFTNAILGEIVPNDVVRFFKFKAFGITDDRDICEQNDRATGCREATLDMYKKSISYYMPNSIPTWDRLHNMGNPTKSVEVNNFLKLVGKFEVRKKGKPSCAKRALKKDEFIFALDLLGNREKDFQRYQMTAMMKLQFHLIGRSDDICKLETDSFSGHADPRFARFALQIKVTWSNKKLEE